MKYVIALDQGTTSSRAVLFDENGVPVASHGVEFPQLYPKPGWVEHRPDDILQSQIEGAARGGGKKRRAHPRISWPWASPISVRPRFCGSAERGEPLCNAIVWQCRRTAPLMRAAQGATDWADVIRDAHRVWCPTPIFPAPNCSGCWTPFPERAPR